MTLKPKRVLAVLAALAALGGFAAGPRFGKTVKRKSADRRIVEAAGLMATRRPFRALRRIEEAVSLDPSYPQARFLLGNVLLMTGDARGAVAHLKAALKDPDNPDIPYDLGLAYAALGELAAARRWYREAERRFRRPLGASPGDPAVLRKLGLFYFNTGRPREALDCLIKTAAAFPDDTTVLQVLERIRKEGFGPFGAKVP